MADMKFLDNVGAPDTFADGASGWSFLNGNIRITFEAARANPASENDWTRVVIGRLVMPLANAEIMAKGLLAFIEGSKSAADAMGSKSGGPTIQ
jgi:hypothetical protein